MPVHRTVLKGGGAAVRKRNRGCGIPAKAQIRVSGAGGGAEMEQVIRGSNPTGERAELPCRIEGLWRRDRAGGNRL